MMYENTQSGKTITEFFADKYPELFPDIIVDDKPKPYYKVDDNTRNVELHEQANRRTGEQEVIELGTWSEYAQEIKDVEWLWEGWLARGFPVIVAGEPGVGKSFLLLYMAGCIINGFSLPTGEKINSDNKVLWIETESADALNISRAKQWGLNMDRIYRLKTNNISFDKTEHKEAIVKYASRPDVDLIIVDSLSAGTYRDARSSSSMQELMGFFAELSRDINKPILISHHLRKRNVNDGERINLDRLRDSSVIAQRARIIWAIDVPDDEDEDNKRLYVIKNNLAKFPKEIGFKSTEDSLEFGNAPRKDKNETLTDKAENWLLINLKGKRLATELYTEAELAGFSKTTLQRAANKINIVMGKTVENDARYYWELPISHKPIQEIMDF